LIPQIKIQEGVVEIIFFVLIKKSNKKEVRIAILQDRSKRRITRNVSVGKQRQKQPTKRESAVNFCFIHGGCIIICTY
jgi:hypothetical protein